MNFHFFHVICNDLMKTEWVVWGLYVCIGALAFTRWSIIPNMLLVSIKCIIFIFVFLRHLKALIPIFLGKHRYGFHMNQLVGWSFITGKPNHLDNIGVLLPSRRYTPCYLFYGFLLWWSNGKSFPYLHNFGLVIFSGKAKMSCRKLDIWAIDMKTISLLRFYLLITTLEEIYDHQKGLRL